MWYFCYYAAKIIGSDVFFLIYAPIIKKWAYPEYHPVLDVVFDEDASRIRTGYAQENLATMRRIAINMLNQEQARKDSLKGKRQLAGWDESYMERIVFD